VTHTSRTTARQINEQPWEPLPGMSKLRCTDCRYWFAAPDPQTKRCVDCELALRRQLRAAEQGELAR
jgi:hypothetical protein